MHQISKEIGQEIPKVAKFFDREIGLFFFWDSGFWVGLVHVQVFTGQASGVS